MHKVNYQELPEVYSKYQNQGFTILAFPCNQFGNQEPLSNEAIDAFRLSKNATFPFFAKSNVNPPPCTTSTVDVCQPSSNLCCPDNNKIYQYLTSVLPGDIGWNFEKFLVGRDGVPVKRYLTEVNFFFAFTQHYLLTIYLKQVDPVDLEPDIELLLAGKPVPPS